MRVKLHTDFCWILIWSFNNTQNIYCINCTNTDRTAIPFWWLWKCVSCLVALSEWYGHVETTISLQIIGLPNNFVEYNDFIVSWKFRESAKLILLYGSEWTRFFATIRQIIVWLFHENYQLKLIELQSRLRQDCTDLKGPVRRQPG